MAGLDWFDHVSTALPFLQPFNAMRSPLSSRMQEPAKPAAAPGPWDNNPDNKLNASQLQDKGWQLQGQNYQRPAAPTSAQNYGVQSANFGTFTGNVAGQVNALMNPNAATGAPDTRGAGQMYDSQRNQLAELRGLANQNGYRQGGQAWTAAMNNAHSRPSGLLQNALQNTQRSAAERGITLGSGLTQQALNQNRNDAAKMAAQLGGQVAQDFAIREAEQDERNRGFLADLTRLEGNLGTQRLNDELAGLRLAMQQDEQQYGRRLDPQLDRFRVLGAGQQYEAGQLANRDAATRLDFLAPSLQQGLTMGQQRLDVGQLGLELQRAVQAGQISAENARNALAAAGNNLDLSVMQNPTYQGMYTTNVLLRALNDGRREIMAPYTEAVGQLQQLAAGALGRVLGGS